MRICAAECRLATAVGWLILTTPAAVAPSSDATLYPGPEQARQHKFRFVGLGRTIRGETGIQQVWMCLHRATMRKNLVNVGTGLLMRRQK
jgi:hypothetical protein